MHIKTFGDLINTKTINDITLKIIIHQNTG